MVQSGAERCGSLSSPSFEAEQKMICEDDIIYPKVKIIEPLSSYHGYWGHYFTTIYASLSYSFKIKKQASFNGETQLVGDGQHTLSRKICRSRIEHPQLSPVHEELMPTSYLVRHSLLLIFQ